MADPTPKPAGHCWDAVLDSGGTVPVCIPMDAESKPFRMVMVTRGEQMFAHYKCCRCGSRATRRWENQRDHAEHGSQHHAFAIVEVETLPAGPCSGTQG